MNKFKLTLIVCASMLLAFLASSVTSAQDAQNEQPMD